MAANGLNIIKASAGSGKTYTLARSYIEHLLLRPAGGRLVLREGRNYHRHILAITFTNKATEEMKQRILKELYQLGTNVSKSDYRDYFKSQCTPEAFEGLQAVARQALSDIMFDYGAFSVSTIDSFFQSILRSFARELDRDYNYDVQIDGNYAVRVAVHNFLLSLGQAHRRAGAEGELERWVKAYMREQVQGGKDWKFFDERGENGEGDAHDKSDLVELAEHINGETFRTAMPEMRKYLYRHDGTRRAMDFDRIHAFKKAVIEARNRYKDDYCERLLDELTVILNDRGMSAAALSGGKTLAKMLKSRNMEQGGEPSKTFFKITADNVVDQFLAKSQAEALRSGVTTAIWQWVLKVRTAWAAWKFLDKLLVKLGLLGLLGAIDEQLELFRHSTNSILLADTNDLIAHVLESGVAFVYERVGTWIHHYLIDEFQDTSARQYDNFRPLLEESLDQNGKDNFNMLIGDAKQSIYRFRNADPSLFRERVEAEMGARYELAHSSLDTNYRSLPAVIEFNNRVFRAIVDRYEAQGIVARTYDGLEQLVSDGKREVGQGYVTVRFKSQVTGEAYGKKEQILADLPAMLLELHRRFEWSQMGLLVNANKDGKAIVECLLKHNSEVRARLDAGDSEVTEDMMIPVVSDESLLLVNSPAVRRIVGLLRFIDLVREIDADETDAWAIERQRQQQRQFVALNRFHHLMQAHPEADAGELLAQSFEAPAEGDDAAAWRMLEQLLPDSRTESSSLVNLVEHLIERQVLVGDEVVAERENAFLLAFQDLVLEFGQQRNGGSVHEFLRYWDTRGRHTTVGASASGNAVNVMTIHTSKGLEFDCVVIPMADWNIGAQRSQGEVYWMTRSQWVEQGGDALVHVDDEQVPPLIPVDRKALSDVVDATGIFEPFYRVNADNTLIDNLNKTYVALTRAGCELHIIACGKTTADEADATVTTLLADVLKPDESGLVESGTCPAGPYPQKKKTSDVTTEHMPPYRVHRTGVMVRLPDEVSASQEQGVRLHNVLSRIATSADLDRALRLCVDRGIIASADDTGDTFNEPVVRGILQCAFDDPVKGRWFATDNVQVLTERSITVAPEDRDRDDKAMRRPDRIVTRPDGTVIVVDYKTGHPRAKDVAQVRHYVQLVRRATAAPRVEGYVWYLATDTVRAVQ